MKFWRSLMMPLYPTSLVVLAFIALLQALVYSVEIAGVLRLLPALLLLSLLFKYAYAVLEQAADGIFEPPVLSAETVGPFEYRPLMQMVVCLLVYKIYTWLPGLPGKILIGLSLVLLPASIGTLGVTGSVMDAANPLKLWRIARGLGFYYLLIIATIICCVSFILYLHSLSIWNLAVLAVSDLSLLSIYAAIGGSIYERRMQLGHEPRSSPERQEEKISREHKKLRNRMLDEVYYPIRVGDVKSAAGPLKQWLSQASADRLERDVAAIMSSALEWKSPRGLQVVARCVVSTLMSANRLQLAIETLEPALRQLPGLALETEEETTVLATYAKSIGRKRFALTLIRNLQLSQPTRPLGHVTAGLQRELES